MTPKDSSEATFTEVARSKLLSIQLFGDTYFKDLKAWDDLFVVSEHALSYPAQMLRGSVQHYQSSAAGREAFESCGYRITQVTSTENAELLQIWTETFTNVRADMKKQVRFP